jgi:hypothetical protein
VIDVNNDGVDTLPISYIPKVKGWKSSDIPKLRVEVVQNDNLRFLTLHTTSFEEFIEAQKSLIRSNFIYDKSKNISKDLSIIFQKNNLTIVTGKEMADTVTAYYLKLKEKKIPDSIRYADDLLQFDSNEFLVSYFGEQNVKKDLYFFSEKELRKCSVLFSGTPYQALFVWGDEENLTNLSYIIISNILPTKSARENGIPDATNNWKFQNGLRPGMTIRSLLRLNEMDFTIYGNKSELAFMAKPVVTGKINFKKTGIVFKCSDCYDDHIFNESEISALDIAKANLPLKIFDIIMYP